MGMVVNSTNRLVLAHSETTLIGQELDMPAEFWDWLGKGHSVSEEIESFNGEVFATHAAVHDGTQLLSASTNQPPATSELQFVLVIPHDDVLSAATAALYLSMLLAVVGILLCGTISCNG